MGDVLDTVHTTITVPLWYLNKSTVLKCTHAFESPNGLIALIKAPIHTLIGAAISGVAYIKHHLNLVNPFMWSTITQGYSGTCCCMGEDLACGLILVIANYNKKGYDLVGNNNLLPSIEMTSHQPDSLL